MTVQDHKNGKLITLSKPLDSRAKVLNIFYFFSFLVVGTMLLKILLGKEGLDWVKALLFLLPLAPLIASYRFINKAMMSEKLFVTKTRLEIIEKGLFYKKRRQFDMDHISAFRHLDKPTLSKHPLAGETFDYLGFQTEQKVINEMHGDKRIGFRYNGRDITFGENIYSWDFEELEILLYDVTGNDFRYEDSYEKAFVQKNQND
jgi:hypothetical protein